MNSKNIVNKWTGLFEVFCYRFLSLIDLELSDGECFSNEQFDIFFISVFESRDEDLPRPNYNIFVF
jgi:hypothetical protein